LFLESWQPTISQKGSPDLKTLLFPQRNLIRRSMSGKDEQQLDVFSYIARSSEFRKTTHCVRSVP
jgi:hypothetical protein